TEQRYSVWRHWTLNRRIVRQRINPAVAVVLEIRIQPANINVRPFAELVIPASRDSPAATVVAVFTLIDRFVILLRLASGQARHVGNWLVVVDPPAGPVERTADQHAKLFLRAEPLSHRSRRFHLPTPAKNRHIAAHSAQRNRRPL